MRGYFDLQLQVTSVVEYEVIETRRDLLFIYTQSGHKLRFLKSGIAQFVTVGMIYPLN